MPDECFPQMPPEDLKQMQDSLAEQSRLEVDMIKKLKDAIGGDELSPEKREQLEQAKARLKKALDTLDWNKFA